MCVLAKGFFALFSEDVADNQKAREQTILGIFAIKKEAAEPTDNLEDVGIIIKGVEEIHNPGNIANALGLMY